MVSETLWGFESMPKSGEDYRSYQQTEENKRVIKMLGKSRASLAGPTKTFVLSVQKEQKDSEGKDAPTV